MNGHSDAALQRLAKLAVPGLKGRRVEKLVSGGHSILDYFCTASLMFLLRIRAAMSKLIEVAWVRRS